MTTFIEDLTWGEHPDDFNTAERRILRSLSIESWDWLTMDGLRKAAALTDPEFNDALESLMSDGYVRAYVNDDWSALIFGLTERVGRGAHPLRDRRLVIRSELR